MKGGLKKMPHQCERLISYIEKNGQISTMQAITELGIINPSARVMELRRAGKNIKTTIVERKNRFGEPCRYAVYTIEKK